VSNDPARSPLLDGSNRFVLSRQQRMHGRRTSSTAVRVRHHHVVDRSRAPTSAGKCRKECCHSWKIDESNDPARSPLPDGSNRFVLSRPQRLHGRRTSSTAVRVRHHHVVDRSRASMSAGKCRKECCRSWKIDVSNDPARSPLPDGRNHFVLSRPQRLHGRRTSSTAVRV